MRRLLFVSLMTLCSWQTSSIAATIHAIDITHDQPITDGTVTIIVADSIDNNIVTQSTNTLLGTIHSITVKTNNKGEFELNYPANTTISGSANYVDSATSQTRYCNGDITALVDQATMAFECYFLGN